MFFRVIEKVLQDKEIKGTFGLALLCLIVGLYTQHRPDSINESNTKRIKIELATKPDYSEPNGDNVPKISFKAKGFENDFDISHCALSLINVSEITRLNIGDKLWVTIDKNDLNKRFKKLVYNPITICGIEKIGNNKILTLKAYNNCERNRWKKITILGIITLGVLIVMMFSKYFKYKKTMANKPQ